MMTDLNPLMIAAFAATGLLVTSVVCILLAKSVKTPKTMYFIGTMVCIAEWTFSELCVRFADSELQLQVSYSLSNFGICFLSTLFLLFSIYYLGFKPPVWLKVLLFSFSTAFYIAVVTNSYHMLYYSSFSILDVDHGPLFWARIAFTYISVVASMVCIIMRCFKDKTTARSETVVIISAMLIPTVVNILYLTNVISTTYDITAIAFSVSMLLFLTASYNLEFLDINATVFSGISNAILAGIVICNLKGKITYYNPFFAECCRRAGYEELPANIDSVSAAVRTLNPGVNILDDGFKSADVEAGDYHYRLSRIDHKSYFGSINAYTFIINDITEYSRQIMRLRRSTDVIGAASEHSELEKIAASLEVPILSRLSEMKAVLNHMRHEIKEGRSDDIPVRLDDMIKSDEVCIAEIRDILEHVNLRREIPLVTGMKHMLGSVSGIDVNFDVDGTDDDIYTPYSDILITACRSLVLMVLKHSTATTLNIVLTLKKSAIALTCMFRGSNNDNEAINAAVQKTVESISDFGATSSLSFDNAGEYIISINVPISAKH